MPLKFKGKSSLTYTTRFESKYQEGRKSEFCSNDRGKTIFNPNKNISWANFFFNVCFKNALEGKKKLKFLISTLHTSPLIGSYV